MQIKVYKMLKSVAITTFIDYIWFLTSETSYAVFGYLPFSVFCSSLAIIELAVVMNMNSWFKMEN